MKLHKANTNGSLSVVIPKDIAELLGWKEGHEIVVSPTEDDMVIKLYNKTLRNK
jgi:AbrB family looped-hinge helix DNA binding protein